ncbi:MAG: hypothetical protein ABI698_08725 [bacterium]
MPTKRKKATKGRASRANKTTPTKAIAPAFVYFASEIDSSYVTGELLPLLGGETTAA